MCPEAQYLIAVCFDLRSATDYCAQCTFARRGAEELRTAKEGSHWRAGWQAAFRCGRAVLIIHAHIVDYSKLCLLISMGVLQGEQCFGQKASSGWRSNPFWRVESNRTNRSQLCNGHST